MNSKTILGATLGTGLLGLGLLAGSIMGTPQAAAQTPAATPTAVVQQAPAAPQAPGATTPSTTKPTVTQQQAEAAALAANPGQEKVDHTQLIDQNGTPVYDVDFANGGGAQVNGLTGALIQSEAAGTDHGGGHGGGADQAALAAQATVTQAQAEAAALAASPGNTVDHSRLGQDASGTVFWDVDFSNGGGVTVNAKTGAVIATEAAGTDHGPGGHRGFGGPGGSGTPGQTPPAAGSNGGL